MTTVAESLWNIASSTVEWIDNIYRMTILPITLFAGIVGQVFSIIIFLKLTEWKSTCKIYYMTMAWADFVYLIIYGIPEFTGDGLDDWLYVHTYWLRIESFSTLTCKLMRYIWHTSWFISYWALVIYSYERLVAIAYPFVRTRFITIKMAKVFCFSLVGFSLISFSVILYSDIYFVLREAGAYEWRYCYLNVTDASRIAMVVFALLYLSTILLPPILLIISNISLFKKLRAIMHERRKLHTQMRNRNRSIANSEIESSKDLIILSLITLFFALPTLTWMVIAIGGFLYNY